MSEDISSTQWLSVLQTLINDLPSTHSDALTEAFHMIENSIENLRSKIDICQFVLLCKCPGLCHGIDTYTLIL